MFSHYIYNGKEKLRCGYTTGTCAAIAAKAACSMLFSKKELTAEMIITPKGIEVETEILDISISEKEVSCAVRKDGGDDVDATDKLLIYASVKLNDNGYIKIDGGKGVGRVTRQGLSQKIGQPAINETPKTMIKEEVFAILKKNGYNGGADVIISVPNGEKIAKKTFNPNLGIQGGISILGTGGIVEPKSIKALTDSIFLQMKIIKANNINSIILTPGNYGEIFVNRCDKCLNSFTVKCSNFIGETLDYASVLGFENVLLIGHIGKFSKLAAGIMNTHSNVADGRREVFAAHAACEGADKEIILKIMDSITTTECIDILKSVNLSDKVLKRIANSAENCLKRRVKGDFNVGIIMFDNSFKIIGQSFEGKEMLKTVFEVK